MNRNKSAEVKDNDTLGWSTYGIRQQTKRLKKVVQGSGSTFGKKSITALSTLKFDRNPRFTELGETTFLDDECPPSSFIPFSDNTSYSLLDFDAHVGLWF
jgi:hypothetical protein